MEGLPGDSNGSNKPFQEIEPNNSIPTAQFVSVFSPPDIMQLQGQFGYWDDIDVYHWFTPQNQLTSIDIHSGLDAVIEALMITKDYHSDNYIILGHWVGDPGQLFVEDWPTFPGNDGIYLILLSPSHIMAPYNVEIWAQ